MEVVRHGRPSSEYLATLKAPTRGDYNKLVRACMEAIISGSVDVLVAFSYVLKFPRGFPKGILERKEGALNIHRIKARKLLDWLHEKGHTDISFDALRQQRIAFSKAEKNFTQFDEIFLDESQQIVDNVKHQQQDKETDD